MDTSQSTAGGVMSWNWYHIVLTTSGAWVSGDPRERTGASPGAARVRWVWPRNRRVRLPGPMRAVVGEALRDGLAGFGARVRTVAVASSHVHIVAGMPEGLARDFAAAAKLYALNVATARGWTNRLWGKRSRAEPIRGRAHQLERLLLRRREPGTWVWTSRRANGSWTGVERAATQLPSPDSLAARN